MAYDASFYEGQMGGSERSARVILPVVFDLIHPASVVDFGCGVGTWLHVARSLGAARVRGLDGEYVDRNLLRIAPEEFQPANLEQPSAQPGFDLAMSLEVAEHLSAAASDRLVEALAGSADAVLFGAAIPGQKGRHHINCQWQSWWAEKFASRGFVVLDALRPRAWGRRDVEYHYLQNTNLYLRRSRFEQSGLSTRLQPVADLHAVDVVHPEAYAYYLAKYRRGLAGWWRRLRGRE